MLAHQDIIRLLTISLLTPFMWCWTQAAYAADNQTVSAVIPHFAVGGGWKTCLQMMGSRKSIASLSNPNLVTTVHFDVVDTRGVAIEASALTIYKNRPSQKCYSLSSETVLTGTVYLAYTSGVEADGDFVSITALFSNSLTGQEASTPALIRPRNNSEAPKYVILADQSKDSSGSYVLGLALLNNNSNPAIVKLTIRGEQGVFEKTIDFSANEQKSFTLSDMMPESRENLWLLEITSSRQGLFCLGFRFNDKGSFTSVPSVIVQ